MKSYKVFVIILSCLGLAGCIPWVDDTSDLKKFVAETNKKPAGKIEPLPEFEPYNAFVYEAASLREPFKALVPVLASEDVSGEESVQPDENRAKDYLESFPVDALAMVGTINQRDDERLWALISDENSEIHRVTVGDYMGLDHGEIVSLDERQINLIEIVTDGRGGWMKRARSLALNEPE